MTFLYCVVGSLGTRPSDMVQLEGCYSVDVVRVVAPRVLARRIRLVTPATATT